MLKAVLCGFSGVVINDEDVHQQLIDKVLLAENLRPDAEEYRQTCFGRSDRACLESLLSRRGRVLKPADYTRLLTKKAGGYVDWFQSLDHPPIYPGLTDLIFRVKTRQYPLALVTTAQRSEVIPVLRQAKLEAAFDVQVTSDLSLPSKPSPAPYATAITQLNQQYPDLHLTPEQCVAVEDTFVGIAAAKAAGVPVIGVAHTYPNYMLQRQANWVVDYLIEIDFDWICQRYGERPEAAYALAESVPSEEPS